MEPEIKTLIQETLKISRENNELLRKMNSAQKWGRFFRILYWLIIIGGSIGVYYYLQEPLQQLLSTYSGLMNTADGLQKTIGSLPDANSLNSIIEKLKQN